MKFSNGDKMPNLEEVRSQLRSNKSLIGKKPTRTQMKYMFDMAKIVGCYSDIHSILGDNPELIDADIIFQTVAALELAVEKKHRDNPEDYIEYLRYKQQYSESTDTDTKPYEYKYEYDYYKNKEMLQETK